MGGRVIRVLVLVSIAWLIGFGISSAMDPEAKLAGRIPMFLGAAFGLFALYQFSAGGLTDGGPAHFDFELTVPSEGDATALQARLKELGMSSRLRERSPNWVCRISVLGVFNDEALDAERAHWAGIASEFGGELTRSSVRAVRSLIP